jgi:neutral ceramidase
MGEPGDFDKASPLVKDLVNNHSIVSDPGYTQVLKKQIVDAVVLANENRVDAKLAVGNGHEDKSFVQPSFADDEWIELFTSRCR